MIRRERKIEDNEIDSQWRRQLLHIQLERKIF